MRQAVQTGMPPAQVADAVFKALREDKFYILTHPDWKERVRIRMEDILQERNPIESASGTVWWPRLQQVFQLRSSALTRAIRSKMSQIAKWCKKVVVHYVCGDRSTRPKSMSSV